MFEGKTIQELLLSQILKTYFFFLTKREMPISTLNLYKQQTFVFNNIIDLDLKASLAYLQQINTDATLTQNKNMIKLEKKYLSKQNPNNVVMDVQSFFRQRKQT